MKRQIEIDDTLKERVENCIEEVKDFFNTWLNENKPDECPCIHNDLNYDGSIDEFIDSCVPIYTKEIEDTWYLYANELEKAYENAGIGDNPREDNGMAAIYLYIAEKVYEWFQENGEAIFEVWKDEQDSKEQ